MMRKHTRLVSKILNNLFVTVVPLTIILYVLRGIGLLSFLKGGIILFLIVFSIFIVIFYLIDKTY